MEIQLSESVGMFFFAFKNLKGRESKERGQGEGEGTAKIVGQVSISSISVSIVKDYNQLLC